jgi:hypothetical protein
MIAVVKFIINSAITIIIIRSCPTDQKMLERLSVTAKKYEDLQVLKKHYPKDVQVFYENIPFKNQKLN